MKFTATSDDLSEHIIVGIDASRNRSGGAKAHLIGLISDGNPLAHGIKEVHLWAYKSLLDAIPDQPWLIKHCPPALEKNLGRQVMWQIFELNAQAIRANCDIMLNTDAGTMSSFKPSVTMSRDMLSYEPGEIERYGFTLARLRLIMLRFIQNRSLRRADGVIFLTRYAAKVIQQSCGSLKNIAFIPHGVGRSFQKLKQNPRSVSDEERGAKILYVSNTAWYKHQWMVVRAVEILRNQGILIELTLVGGGSGPAQERLERQVHQSDPRREFVVLRDHTPHTELLRYLANSDVFVFASSCENMPNTLLEAMAAGLPIACSRRGPMPEVLENAGEYFDPEDPQSIADSIRKLIENPKLRCAKASHAKSLAAKYSWRRCATETWDFLVETYRGSN